MDSGYPKSISGNFEGLPAYMEEKIYAALWRGSNGKVYFFGKHPRRTLTDYVRFSNIFQPIDDGYPKYVGGLSKDEAEALWRDPVQAKLGVGSGTLVTRTMWPNSVRIWEPTGALLPSSPSIQWGGPPMRTRPGL